MPVSKSGRPRVVVLHAEAAVFFDALALGRSPDEHLLLRAGSPPTPWARSHQIRPMAEA